MAERSMAADTPPNKLSGLARILIHQKLLSEEEATAIQTAANSKQVSFINQILQSRQLTALQVAQAASHAFGFPLLDLNTMNADFIPAKGISPQMMQNYRAMTLYNRGNNMFVALSDPTNLHLLDEVQFQTGKTLVPVIVEDDKLGKWIDKLVEARDTSMQSLVSDDDFGLDTDPEEKDSEAEAVVEIDDAPVVKYIHKILLDAINMGASDLHFEPYEKFYRIRYRVDGILREIAQPPLAIKEKLASRIKVISNLDISEKRVPQDGRMKLVLSKTRTIDFRVSTLPLINGEKIVMRILDPSSAKLGIDALGYEPDQKEALLRAVTRPYGLVLVTGPTGSGKTVSLYTCLNILNEPGVNISTAEDPAEIPLAGINQVNVNDKQGLTFSAALKSFLRQDPDIIMIGEIRDLETAEMAIQAALTGHLVLSTLHTNDAPSAVTRLLDLGVAAYLISSTLLGVMAQRLVRTLCPHCKQSAPISESERQVWRSLVHPWKANEPTQLHHAVGCLECRMTGYSGRVGVYEILLNTPSVRGQIRPGAEIPRLREQAFREGMRPLRISGALKVAQGLTTLEELMKQVPPAETE